LSHATIHQFISRLDRRRHHLTGWDGVVDRCAAVVCPWLPNVGLALLLAVLSGSMVAIVRLLLGEPWALTAFRFGCLLVLLLTAG
jgi:hypothetical protein